MEDFTIKRYYKDLNIIDITTDKGIFSIIEKDNNLYWAYNQNYTKDKNQTKTFLITEEDYYLHQSFEHLYKQITKNINNEIIYPQNKTLEKSSITIKNANNTFIVTFHKSKEKHPNFTIKFNDDNPLTIYFKKMYQELLTHDRSDGQTNIEDYIKYQKSLQRKKLNK